jgi:repressor LexA
LRFITEFIQNYTYPPTIREIGSHFDISVKGAYDHVDALRKKGYIRMGDKRSRTIEIVRTEQAEDSPVIEVPLVGMVAAGRPILAEENREGTVHIDNSFLKRGAQYFALRVRGDSMNLANIREGDIAVIEKRDYVENGEIVVALVEDGLTLKRYFKEPNRIRLEPDSDNPANKPIYTQEARIEGRLAHLIHSY